ncbi:hypothetical protein SBOR_2136 [Sclerotinia borealis F-4128]|uniref:Uncharacterized protein n=1 Tax=Sclerotinia borealis (strain F-4128) TaxID=1432307 RepID=W9CKX5_SCLBF|nr:hypothetical protein SBOR_2136 [Sclerotinia borealis F-4128]
MATRSSSSTSEIPKPNQWEFLWFELCTEYFQSERMLNSRELKDPELLRKAKKSIPEVRNLNSDQLAWANLDGRRYWIAYHKKLPKSQQDPDRQRRLEASFFELEPDEESRTSVSSDETVRGDIQHPIIDDDGDVRIVGVIHKK